MEEKKTRRERPDVVLRNKSFKQRDAVKASWESASIKTARITHISEANKKAMLGNKNALGHNLNAEQRKYLSENHKGLQAGSKHPNWKGGISPRVMGSNQYKDWRVSVFERDDFTCQTPKCGQRGGNLEAHHIKSFAKYPGLRLDVDNGQPFVYLAIGKHLEFRLP